MNWSRHRGLKFGPKLNKYPYELIRGCHRVGKSLSDKLLKIGLQIDLDMLIIFQTFFGKRYYECKKVLYFFTFIYATYGHWSLDLCAKGKWTFSYVYSFALPELMFVFREEHAAITHAFLCITVCSVVIVLQASFQNQNRPL